MPLPPYSFSLSTPLAKQPLLGRRLAAIIALLALLPTGCQRPAPRLIEPPPPEVVVATPLTLELAETLEFTGNAAAVETVEIKARVSGFITQVHFEDGQRVEAGDPLFTIDERPYAVVRDQAKAEVAKAVAELEELKSEVARYQTLLPRGVVTEEQYEILVAKRDVAKAMLDKANAAVTQAELDLEFCHVASPLSGRVSTREVDVGDLVSGSGGGATRLTTAITTAPVRVYFDTDERALLQARQQAIAERGGKAVEWRNVKELKIPVAAQLVTETGFPHQGILDFVDIGVKPTTGTVRCRGEFPNADGLITPGMFLRVQLTIGQPAATVLVPELAIGVDQGRRYVAVVDHENRVMHRPVETGRSVAHPTGMLRVITHGLDGSERLVISGMARARDGSLVRPVPEADIPAEQPGAASL
jgi:RND family efflux transporter MFP subunit